MTTTAGHIRQASIMFKESVDFIRTTFGTSGVIPLHEPRFNGKEKEYLADCIDSTYVSSIGKYVDEFEKRIREYTGARSAVAVVNGTAGLHTALMLAGVKAGDLVITQPLCFVATSNAIAYQQATPLYIDVDKRTLGLSPVKLEEYLMQHAVLKDDGYCYHKTLGKRITACVPMHTFGHPVELDEIVRICNDYQIVLIEDAAESLGSTYNGRHTGVIGKMGVYSFNGNKTITCGGGGILVTNDEQLGKRAKHLTTTARVSHPWEIMHDETGYNYRLPNLNAALACAQMEQLDFFLKKKRELAGRYKTYFESKGVTFITEPEGSRSNYWLNALLLIDRKERDEFLDYSNKHSVMTRPAWTVMTHLKMYRNCPAGNLDNSYWLEDRLVNIPSSVIL